jgi:hypothetical protein
LAKGNQRAGFGTTGAILRNSALHPSDVVAGRLLSRLTVADLPKNPAFQEDLEKAKAEIASVAG